MISLYPLNPDCKLSYPISKKVHYILLYGNILIVLAIYEISTTLIGAVNTFYKDKKLVDKILKDGQNAIDKLIETTTYLSSIVTDITNSYLVDPYKEEKTLLFDLQIPNSTSNDCYKLSGTENIN